MPDGLLIIDKPAGPTSHDVVARARRALREKRIGHTGTLDPMATGVLLLVVGKATRLAKFLSAGDKSYDAVVRFGFATDTGDAQGRALGPVSERPLPTLAEIDAALDAFRGTFMQQPPAFSAKKIDGQRSYKLARASRVTHAAPGSQQAAPGPLDRPALPPVARVTTHAIRIMSMDGDQAMLGVDCSAGFYVRSLAHDLGERLGVGAHLTALRRTRVGEFALDRALALDAAEREPERAAAAIVPLAGVLPGLPSCVLTAEGVSRVGHGQDVRPGDQVPAVGARPSAMDPEPPAVSHQPFVRLLDQGGALLAIAERAAGGVLHPSIVLV